MKFQKDWKKKKNGNRKIESGIIFFQVDCISLPFPIAEDPGVNASFLSSKAKNSLTYS